MFYDITDIIYNLLIFFFINISQSQDYNFKIRTCTKQNTQEKQVNERQIKYAEYKKLPNKKYEQEVVIFQPQNRVKKNIQKIQKTCMPKEKSKTRKKQPSSTLQTNKKDHKQEEQTSIIKTPQMRVYEANRILRGELLPTKFKFREKQVLEIEKNIHNLIGNTKGLCKIIMVTGSPGAGKTLSTNHVLQKLQKQKSYKIIFLNSNKLKKKRDIQQILCSQLLSQKSQKKKLENLTTFKILQYLEQKHESLPPTILYIEQIQLFFNSHKQFYTEEFFDLFVSRKLNILLLGISNTIDTLVKYCHKMDKIKSKDVVNIVFKPYTVEQMKDIVLEKLKQVEHVLGVQVRMQQKLARFIAKKIDQQKKGDMRKVFQFLKNLSQQILPQQPDPDYQLPQKIEATIKQISHIFQKSKPSKISLLLSLPILQQIILISIYTYIKQTQDTFIQLQNIKNKVDQIYHTLKFELKEKVQAGIPYLLDYGMIEKKVKVQRGKDKGKAVEKQSVRYLLKLSFDQIQACFEKDGVLGQFV